MQLQSNAFKDIGTDHMYFNMTFSNNSTVSYIPAKIIQQYDRAILNSPQDWNCSVVRFSISSDSIARVYQPYPTTTLTTTFFVSLSYNNTYYDTPVVLPTISTLDQTATIQAVYSIFDFLDLINAAYATSVSSLPGGAPIGLTGSQPLLTYDPSTELYTMNIPATYGTGTISTSTSTIGVHMSYQLFRKFGSFSVTINNPLLNNNHDVSFVRQWRGDNYTTLTFPVSSGGTGTTGPYMQLKQDAPWASSIENVDRLLICSTSIPAILEYRSQQLYQQFQANNGNQTLNILVDFFIGSDSQVINNSEQYIYTPNIFRITSLQGNSPLRQLDVQIFAGTTDGAFFPLLLGPNDDIDIKLLFIKKGLTS